VHLQPAIAVAGRVQARAEAIPDDLGSGLTVHAPDVKRAARHRRLDQSDPLYNALIYR